MQSLKRKCLFKALVAVLANIVIFTSWSSDHSFAYAIETMSPYKATSTIAEFEITYVDTAHYIVGTQTVQYSSAINQEVSLDIGHLSLPRGYYLHQVWEKYTVKYGEVCHLELEVCPEQVALARSFEGLEGRNQTAITLNYVESTGRIVFSETIKQENVPSGSLKAVFKLHENYEIHIPEGYQLCEAPPEFLQGRRLGRTDFYLEIEPNIPGVDPFYYGKGSGDGGNLIKSSPSVEELVEKAQTSLEEYNLVESSTSIYLFYLDEGENLIDSQFLCFPGTGYILLKEEDLKIPNGYELLDPWIPYYTENGETLTVSFVISPTQNEEQSFESESLVTTYEEDQANSQNLNSFSSIQASTRSSNSFTTQQPLRKNAEKTATFQNVLLYFFLACMSYKGFTYFKKQLKILAKAK